MSTIYSNIAQCINNNSEQSTLSQQRGYTNSIAITKFDGVIYMPMHYQTRSIYLYHYGIISH
jgi:hypothetical protein